MTPRTLARLLTPLALAALATAQDQPPKVTPLLPGDAAPALRVAEWIQGDAVESFQKGKPYVVEFWATWCSPCKVSIPHIDGLYRKYAPEGLEVIGVSIWESDPTGITPFVKAMAESMSYTVARDLVPEGDERGSNGFMSLNWMRAAGQNGIPAAFLVDREGRVAWIGHPMEMDEPLAGLMAGTWDVKKAREEFVAKRERDEKLAAINKRIGAALQEGDFKSAAALLDEVAALDPQMALTMAPMRFDWLLKSKDLEAAYGWVRKAIEGDLGKNAPALNAIAWMIVDPDRTDLERRDLDLALAVAQKADVASKHVDANVVDTLARVCFLRGEVSTAIALQEKAVRLAESEGQKASLRRTLEEYKAGG